MNAGVEEHVDAFIRFVGEVHEGREPFPWQSDLVRRILAGGRWPDAIDAPTGLGKTAVLDAAVFLASVSPHLARRRIFFVVDRRIVVDEAHEHAERLARALTDPRGPETARVAAALRQPRDEDGPVLTVTRMRGGVTWERQWVERPDRYAIVTGTVDQVGSRLLFRGYGVTDAARPIDAALVGTDSLILVDEAHLAQSFLTTARAALAAGPCPWAPEPVLVTLSATPRTTGLVHGISSADRAHLVAGRRLNAGKRMHLVTVSATKAKAPAVMAQAVADFAVQLATAGAVVGAVANTVSRARAVFEAVQAHQAVDAVLLTGRSRGVDRQMLMDEYYPRMRAGRARTPGRPLIVVATQTVEVGANIDLDALVSESAAWPALVQRLGRLNRLGEHPGPEPVPAIVVHDESAGEDDYVYGPARAATWAWLTTHTEPHTYTAKLDVTRLDAGIPASPVALRSLAGDAPAGVQSPEPYTPVLLQPALFSWVRTAPIPHPDTPVAPFLHGISAGSEPVTVLWRAGLADMPADRWAEALDALPPTSGEGIDVSPTAARRWLETATSEPTVTDLDGTADTEPPAETSTVPYRVRDLYGRPLVLAYRANGDARVIPAAHIRPGMTLVAPAEYGGCDYYGWHPQSTAPVIDVADIADRRSGALLRIGPSLRTLASSSYCSPRDPGAFDHTLNALAKQAEADAAAESAPDAGLYKTRLEELAEAGPGPLTSPLGRTLAVLARGRVSVTAWPSTEEERGTPTPWHVLVSVKGTTLADDDTQGASSAGIEPLGLAAHQQAVAKRAAEFAENLKLPAHLIEAVRLAARYHDEGKRDLRFQAMLHRGSREEADIAAEPLAKSGIDPADRGAFRRAQRRSGYPARLRHEELSERITARYLAESPDADQQLILHLVASHHGHARPLMPAVADPSPIEVPVDGHGTIPSHAPVNFDAVDRFNDLNHAHGPWGLALLETIVRKADIWASIRNEGPIA